MIVEDGTGIANANSYVTVAFADDYFSARGVSDWDALEDSAKSQSLIRATDYIDSIFQWLGKKEFETQSLRFPRVNLVDYEGNVVTGVPTCLKQAVCDAAMLLSNGTELFQVQSETGDVVSENITQLSFTYSKVDRQVTSKTLYDAINTKLRGLYIDSAKNRIITGRVERV